MIGDSVLEGDVVPREIALRPVANIEPILRLESMLFKGLKNEGFIDVIFAMCIGDGNETSEQRRDTNIESPMTVRNEEENRRQNVALVPKDVAGKAARNYPESFRGAPPESADAMLLNSF